jgi:hypothetical protein
VTADDLRRELEETDSPSTNSSREYGFGIDGLQSKTGMVANDRVLCFASRHQAGHCVYGPYQRIFADRHLTVRCRFSLINIHRNDHPVLYIDLYCANEDRILTGKMIYAIDLGSTSLRDIELKTECRTGQILEARIYWYGTCDIECHPIDFQFEG